MAQDPESFEARYGRAWEKEHLIMVKAQCVQSRTAERIREANDGRRSESRTLPRLAFAILAAAGLFMSASASAADVPDFMRAVVQGPPPSKRAVAERNVLMLNTAMNEIYGNALVGYKRNLREQSPIILALFNSAGGQMLLYRPGKPPVSAEPVPIVYQLMKSVSHSSMAIFQLTAPYLRDPSDSSWQGPMLSYKVRCQAALDGLDALDLTAEHRDLLRTILKKNVAFLDRCITKGTFTYEEFQTYAREFKPYFAKTIGIAAGAQVGHWMSVLEGWKKELGKDWDRTYAATNSLYVTRQNNILFTVLAQFMGEDAIGDRLFLLETTEFTTNPDTMLDLITRIVADRALGEVFFKDYFLMDVELLSTGARDAIKAETAKRGMKTLLPELAPFHSREWPWRTNRQKGNGPATLDEVK